MNASFLAASQKGLAMDLLREWLLIEDAGTERVPASVSMGSSTSC